MSDKQPDLVIAPNERKTLETIAGDECRWPYGDPLRPDFYLCGKPKAPASPTANFTRGGVSRLRPDPTGHTFQSAEERYA